MERRGLLQYAGLATVTLIVEKCMPTYTGGKAALSSREDACPEGTKLVGTDTIPAERNADGSIARVVIEDRCVDRAGNVTSYARK